MKMTRREFMGTAAMAAAGSAFGAAKPAEPRLWGCLLHLGSNMWGDYDEKGPDGWAKSFEELKTNPNPMCPGGTRPSSYHSFLYSDEACWKAAVDHMAERKLNFVFIDVGESLAYPSHPELAVPGTWSVEKYRRELARIRSLGLTPYPKLNFSSAHDSWLKDYHRMLSTPKYYQVVADVIRDVIEVFDTPELFHIGYDEEMAVAHQWSFHGTVRQGDLWWHDLFYTVNEVTKRGSRPVMWADAIWTGRAEFLKRMSKDVLQSNWYYRADFSEKKLKWNYEFEKKGGWGETVNGAAAFMALEEAGFDQLPCSSNWTEDGANDAVVRYCRDHIDPSRLKGFYNCTWEKSLPDEPDKPHISKIRKGTDQIADAREKYYGA